MRSFRIVRALLRLYMRSIPEGWSRRPPFLPAPSSKYIQWRMATAYGQSKPGLRVVLADLWQFGGWLADFDSSHRSRSPKSGRSGSFPE